MRVHDERGVTCGELREGDVRASSCERPLEVNSQNWFCCELRNQMVLHTKNAIICRITENRGALVNGMARVEAR